MVFIKQDFALADEDTRLFFHLCFIAGKLRKRQDFMAFRQEQEFGKMCGEFVC